MDKHVSRTKRRKLDHEMSAQSDTSNVETSVQNDTSNVETSVRNDASNDRTPSPILSVSERIRQFVTIYGETANVSKPKNLCSNYSINVDQLKKDISSSRHFEGEEETLAPDVNERRKKAFSIFSRFRFLFRFRFDFIFLKMIKIWLKADVTMTHAYFIGPSSLGSV